MYRSITFNEAETSAPRRVTVGHAYDGRKVLAIAGDDPVTVVREGGYLTSIQAGSVVRTEPWDDAPAARRRESVVRKRSVERPKGRPGTVIGITYAEQHGSKTVYLNDSHSFESMVTGFGMGEPGWIALQNGRVIEVAAGAVARWHVQE
jgi:hypothetical protein